MKFKLDRNSSHLAGEYFVPAELYRRGFSVAMTLGNAKAIDLFTEQGTRTVNVQVKTIQHKKSVGWTVTRRQIRPNIIYIFVCLNIPDGSPEYYICTAKEARKRVREYKTRSIVNLSKFKGAENSRDFNGQWKKVRAAREPVASKTASRKRGGLRRW